MTLEPITPSLFRQYVKLCCSREGVEARDDLVNLVEAISRVESSMIPWLFRYEKHYRWTIDLDTHSAESKVSIDSELQFQKTSFGLMQIMGAVARERGLRGPLSQLFDSVTNIRYGLKHILHLKRRYSDMNDVISSYNQGSPRKDPHGEYVNVNYVSKVLSNFDYVKQREEKLSKLSN